jgi:hypothetical protein
MSISPILNGRFKSILPFNEIIASTFMGPDRKANIIGARYGCREGDFSFVSSPWCTLEVTAEFKSEGDLDRFLDAAEGCMVFPYNRKHHRFINQEEALTAIHLESTRLTFDVGICTIPYMQVFSKIVNITKAQHAAFNSEHKVLNPAL